MLERACLINVCNQALCLRTPLPLSFTHHISLGAGTADPAARGLQAAQITSRDPSCPLEEACSWWETVHRGEGAADTHGMIGECPLQSGDVEVFGAGQEQSPQTIPVDSCPSQ